MSVKKLIEEVNNCRKIPRTELYVQLIEKRLDLALHSYYKDLCSTFQAMEWRGIENPLRIIHKVNKED